MSKLVKVEVVQDFKSHDMWCHPGEVRMVEPDLAAYFVEHGWAKLAGTDAASVDRSDKTLEVQDALIASGSTAPA